MHHAKNQKHRIVWGQTRSSLPYATSPRMASSFVADHPFLNFQSTVPASKSPKKSGRCFVSNGLFPELVHEPTLSATALILTALTLVDVILLAHVVGDQAATSPDTRTNRRALRSAHQSADNRSAHCRSANDLRLGVVMRVMLFLYVLGMVVLITMLGRHAQRHHEHAYYNCLSHKSFHRSLLKNRSQTILQSASFKAVFYSRDPLMRCRSHVSQMHSINISCGQPLRFFEGPVYRKDDVCVVHRVLRFSVPLLVASSGRGGLTSAEIEEPQQTASKSPEPRTHKSRGFRRFRERKTTDTSF